MADDISPVTAEQESQGPPEAQGSEACAAPSVGWLAFRGRHLVVGGSLLAGALVLAGLTIFMGGRDHQAHGKTGPNGNGEPRGEIPVNTVTSHKKTLVKTLEQPGSFKPWAQAELFAKTSGYLKRFACEAGADGKPGQEKNIDSRVEADEILVEIDVPELALDVAQKESLIKQAEAELEQAKTNVGAFVAAVELAGKQLIRLKDLARTKNISEELVDEKQSELLVVSSKLANAKADIMVKEARVRVARDDLERARILARYAQIRAPFSGVITYRSVDVGDFVQNATTGQSKPLLTVTAIDKVRFVLQVPEKEAMAVHRGTKVHIKVDALNGMEIQGTVTRANRTLDAQSRTRQVEVDLDNPESKLLPEMYGEATLVLQKHPDAQAVPATAVYSRKGENFILLVHDGIVHRQKVRIRFDDGKELEVVKLIDGKEIPLDGTEELIVSNKGEIAEGQRVRSSKHAPR